ncbi:MAG: hypothetical protein KQA41_03730 [Candidatus Aenigmarchaeota archaeon]|nr:hypothetical protein [Candidatus Aenigmarchaeota archaeon]
MKFLLYDFPSLDEYIIFRELSLETKRCALANDIKSLSEIYDSVIVNRIQNRQLRRIASNSFGEKQINPRDVVNLCANKIQQKIFFKSKNLPTADFALPGLPENRDNDVIEIFMKRVQKEIGDMPWVIKPTESGRGNSVITVYNRDDLERYWDNCIALKRSEANIQGPIVEKLIPHPFDLRVVLSFYDNKTNIVAILARVAEKQERIAKNTSRGSIPIGIFELPEQYINLIRQIYFPNSIVGLDIIPLSDKDPNKIYSLSSILYIEWLRLVEKRGEKKINLREDYSDYLRHLENIYDQFKRSKNYELLQRAVYDYLSGSKPYFVEINDRPDFAYNTRLLALRQGNEITEEMKKILLRLNS